PPADADKHHALNLEDITAVKSAGRLDPADSEAQRGQRRFGAGDLGLALVGARARDDSEVTMDHDRVLHEHRIGAIVGRRNFDELPALGPQRVDVPMLLSSREVEVDRRRDAMRDQALSQTWAWTADECTLVPHAIVSHRSTARRRLGDQRVTKTVARTGAEPCHARGVTCLAVPRGAAPAE